ncbi:hypothetical protein ACWCQL_32365 [Streptomyces sp. NPDC002073]
MSTTASISGSLTSIQPTLPRGTAAVCVWVSLVLQVQLQPSLGPTEASQSPNFFFPPMSRPKEKLVEELLVPATLTLPLLVQP